MSAVLCYSVAHYQSSCMTKHTKRLKRSNLHSRRNDSSDSRGDRLRRQLQRLSYGLFILSAARRTYCESEEITNHKRLGNRDTHHSRHRHRLPRTQ